MDSKRHASQMNLLVDSLRVSWKEPDFFVAGNMAVYYSETQAKKNDFKGPDVFVALDTQNKERKSWVVWEEGGRTPDVVIELLSPTTEKNDRGEKMRVYARVLHVSNYYLFDPFTGALEGYELDTRSLNYQPVEPDAQGYLPVPRMNLRLGVAQGRYSDITTKWLRWIDNEGNVLLHPEELAAKEAQRAEQEAQRAEKLEAKLAEYERRFGKLDEA